MVASRLVHRRHLGVQLRRFPPLRSWSATDLATLQRHSVEASFAVGDLVCREGAPGRQAFLILEGEATVEVGGVEVNRIGSGEFVGEMALLTHAPRTATVIARTPLTVLVFSVQEFTTVLWAVPTLARHVATVLAERLRVGQMVPQPR